MDHVYIRLLIFLYTAEKSSADVEIAKALLQEYEHFPDILIEDIARLASTTPASVTKFCHKLNYKSFRELRNDCIREEKPQSIYRQLELAGSSYSQAFTGRMDSGALELAL